MTITVFPVTEAFAAEIGDVDCSKKLAPDEREQIKATFWRYAVVVFPGQRLTTEQHLAFAANFGPLETAKDRVYSGQRGGKLRIDVHLADVSNLSPESTVWEKESRQRRFQLANRLWHTDSSFKKVPALASFLYARTIAPVGGQTEFCDERAAWDALPDSEKRDVEHLVAEHSIITSRTRLGFTDFTDEERREGAPMRRPLVRTLPQSGRKSLYLASHIGRIEGLGEADARALADRLIAHATQRQFVYTHRWREGDLVVWDNRCTMHRGLPFDDLRWQRDVQRATVSDMAYADP